MSFARRFALGVLTVLLLAVAAAAAGFAMRQGAPSADRADTVTYQVPEPSPPRTSNPPPVGRPMEDRTPPPALDSKPSPTKVLVRPGDKGAAVRDVQARLKQIAWYFGDVTGEYGDATVEAVRGFQAKREIPVTGQVDQRTLDRLHAMTTTPTYDQKHNIDPEPGALDPRCLTGRVLCVDKATNTMWWVIDGEAKEDYEVRFGSAELPTREGEFQVYLKSRDHVSSLYNTSMPFAMFFSGGQAVHYSPDFAAVGYDGASHGCVNVRDYDGMAALFDEVQVGDRVVVYWS